MRIAPPTRARLLAAGLVLLQACASASGRPSAQEIADREAARIAGESGSRVENVACPGFPAPRVIDRATVEAARLPCPLPGSSDSVRIAVLATNDFHGALHATTPRWAEGDTIGGAAVLAGWIRAVEERFPGATLHLDGGDVMQGTLVSNLTAGRATVDVFEALGVDAAAIGNHEFDWGEDTLAIRIAEADFPWLTANTFEKATGERPDWATPYAWLEAGGLRVAVIGVTTTSTPVTTLPTHVAHLEFRDIAEVVNELAPRVKAEGADLVLVAAHAGAIAGDEEGEWIGEIADAAYRIEAPVDLIVSGHTHSHVDAVVNGIPIVQARSSGTAIGVVTLTYVRSAGRVVDHTIEIWTPRAGGVQADSEVARLVARHGATVAGIAARPIATMAEPLASRPREVEMALGDLIADAQRAATGAQIVFMNPGGIRADFEAGPVTYADVYRVQPFQNQLVRLELTGEQVRRVLEHAVDNRVGQVSGIRFSFDPTLPPGERVREATLEDDGEPVVRDGRAVRPAAIYDVVVNNFLAAGGDGYTTLTQARRAESTGLIDSDVLVHHLAEMPQPIRYAPRGRITRLAPWPPVGEE